MRLGFLVSSLGASQLAFHILQQGNEHLKKRNDVDILVFYQNIVKAWTTPTFGMMNISEAYDFSGVAIATDLATAEKMMKCPGPSSRAFYVWDLEWVTRPGNYERYAGVYCNEKIRLIARSRYHADAIESAWNRPVSAVVENCSLTGLMAVFDGQR